MKMTIEEWAKDFKVFINELQMPKDDYKGIIAYIEDGVKLLKAHKKGYWINPTSLDCCCSECGGQPEYEPGSSIPLYDYCPYCGAEMAVKWND